MTKAAHVVVFRAAFALHPVCGGGRGQAPRLQVEAYEVTLAAKAGLDRRRECLQGRESSTHLEGGTQLMRLAVPQKEMRRFLSNDW